MFRVKYFHNISALSQHLPNIFIAAVSYEVKVLEVCGHVEHIHGECEDQDLDDEPHEGRARQHS